MRLNYRCSIVTPTNSKTFVRSAHKEYTPSTIQPMHLFWCYKQGVALTERNTTGLPCSVGRPTVHVPRGRPARPPAAFPRRVQTLPATVLTVKNFKFRKSKMAAAAILKNRKISISLPRFERLGRNLHTDAIITGIGIALEGGFD